MRIDHPSRSLLRRPLLALLVILVMIAAGAFVGWTRHDTSTFQSTASVVVVPAPTDRPGSGEQDNPLAALDDTTAQLALVVSTQLDARAVRDTVLAAGGDGDYVADTMSSQDSATAELTSIIKLTATGPTAAGAQNAVQALLAQAADQLASVQSAANVPAAARARVIEVSPADAGVVVGQRQLAAAAVFGAAAGLAALLLILVAGLLVGGRRRAATDTASTVAASAWVVPTPGRAAVAAPPQVSVPAGQPLPEGEGRFAQPSDDPAAAEVVPVARRRQELLRDMVREDWQRSGSNVPWTRGEQREAYERAELRLAERERRRHDLEIENVSGLGDFLHRDHG